jgi:hypothetical protein
MSKKISVKVSRIKLLEQLKGSLRKAIETESIYDKATAEHDKEVKAIHAKVVKNLGKGKVTECRDSTGHYERTNKVVEYTITVTFPDTFFVKPKSPSYPDMLSNYERTELKQIIKMLELCDDEFVSTGVYGNVARYI